MSLMLIIPLFIVLFSNVKIWRIARESTEYLRQAGYVRNWFVLSVGLSFLAKYITYYVKKKLQL